jgi:hypothetical protein
MAAGAMTTSRRSRSHLRPALVLGALLGAAFTAPARISVGIGLPGFSPGINRLS